MKNVLVQRSFGTATDNRLIAAGPLTKQPCTKPFRLVLLQFEAGKLSVHTEIFEDEELVDKLNADPDLQLRNHRSSLEHGSYFSQDELVKALQRFNEKQANLLRTYDSIYRDDALKPVTA